MGTGQSLDGHEIFQHWDVQYENVAELHRNMHNVFLRVLYLYLSIVTVPLTLVIVIGQAVGLVGAIQQETWLLPTFRLVCLLIGIAGVLFVLILMRYRFLIIESARWLNGLRQVLVQSGLHSWIRDTGLPTNPRHPAYYEPLRETGLLVIVGAVINSFYFYLVYSLPHPALSIGLIWWLIGSVGFHELIYYALASQREHVGRA